MIFDFREISCNVWYCDSVTQDVQSKIFKRGKREASPRKRIPTFSDRIQFFIAPHNVEGVREDIWWIDGIDMLSTAYENPSVESGNADDSLGMVRFGKNTL